MYADTECMIANGLNFSVANLLADYTGIIGSVYNKNIGLDGCGRNNYNTILIRMGYSTVIEAFKKKFGKEPYRIIRCGLIHQYLIKKKANIHSNPDACEQGIYIDNDTIIICNRKYFEHLKKVIDDLILEINNDSGKKKRINNQLNGINLTQTSGNIISKYNNFTF